MASEDSDQFSPGLLAVAGPVGVAVPSPTSADEPVREATFSVYETNSPAKPDQPFLLIFRTARIVTAHDRSRGRVPGGYTGFPAYSRILPTLLPAWRATIYLRTVPGCYYSSTRRARAVRSFLADSHGRP
jgi:hypothetical protein